MAEPCPEKQQLLKQLSNAMIDAVLRLFNSQIEKHEYSESATRKKVIVAKKQYCDIYDKQDNPGNKGEHIPHKQPEYQLAYLIQYFYPHIAVTMDVLKSIEDNHKTVFNSTLKSDAQVRVCCLGGGPLPEIFALGLSMHLSGDLNPESVIVHSLDLHATVWKESYDVVADALAEKKITAIPKTNVQPVNCDLSDFKEVKKNLECIQRSNIVFASKVFSDIWNLYPDHRVKKNIVQILNAMPIGALFIYIDNCHGASADWLQKNLPEMPYLKSLDSGCYPRTIEPALRMPRFYLSGKMVEVKKQEKKVIVGVFQRKSEIPPPASQAKELPRSLKPAGNKRAEAHKHPAAKRLPQLTSNPDPNLYSTSPPIESEADSFEELFYATHPKSDELKRRKKWEHTPKPSP